MTNINKIIEEFNELLNVSDDICSDHNKLNKWVKENKTLYKGYAYPESPLELDEYKVETFIIKALKTQEQEHQETLEEILIDQLQRFRGVLGKYNCQHGGRECNFQTNCHRLIEKEIKNLRTIKNI